MKIIKLTIISILLMIIPLLTTAQDIIKINLVPYYTILKYNDSQVKNDGFVTGGYGYLGQGNHSLEAELDYSKINYKYDYELKQWDFTGVYTNYKIPSYKLRLGSHYISVKKDPTDKGMVFFGGVNYFVPYQWNAGIDGYFSLYKDFKPELKVYQVTPKLGFTFGNRVTHTFYAETKGYFIQLSDTLNTKDKSFYSLQESIYLYYKDLTVNVYGWTGEQIFAVRDDGFTVYNLAEKHNSGFGGGIGYNLFKTANCKVDFKKEFFNDMGTNNEANSTSMVFSAGMTF